MHKHLNPVSSIKADGSRSNLNFVSVMSWEWVQSGTFLSKDPPLVHAGGEEDGRLSDAHQQVCDRQVNDEHIGRCPQAATPAGHIHTHTHTR